ncbi:MAG: phage portal protein, partial [Actinobacteria bacterium]|nr:phage portal protein [Actinomycetota bacterium]
RERLDDLWRRYEGDPPLPESARSAKAIFQAFLKKSRTNYAELIPSAVMERMIPVGFRTGAAGDENGDQVARRVWAANEMDVEAADIHEFMCVLGDGYAIVGPPEPGGELPVITAEDPRQVITAHDPVRQSRTLAGLKMYWDGEAEQDVAFLYLPGEVHVARREGKHSALGPLFRFSAAAWSWDSDAFVPLPVEVGVPVVRYRNRRGVGEFEPHVDLLDRINHMILQRMVIATLQAFRQRAIKGVPVADPKTGERIDYEQIFSADPGALWILPATAEMWESGQVDLTPILSSVRDDAKDLATVTRTPFSYFNPDAANGSAEGASLQREGLVYKTEDRLVRAGAGHRRTMSLAFRYLGDTVRADPLSIETLWRPVERFSLAERYDAAVKAKAAGVPWRSIMTDILQFTPDQVARMETERADDVLLAPFEIPEPAPLPAGRE